MKGNWFLNILPLLIIVIAAFVTIIAIIVSVIRKQKSKSLQLRAQGFLEKGARGNGNYLGVEYSYLDFQGGKNAPPYFRVSVECPSAGDFKITREKRFDRFFKRLGICVELETRDPEFDDAFFITTETVGFTREFFSKPEKRRAIKEIFDKGFNLVRHKGKKEELTATWNSFPRGSNMAIKTVEEVAALLGQLGREIPTIYEQETVENAGWKQKRFFAYAVPIFLLAAGIAGLVTGLTAFRPLDEWDVVLDSFKYSIPLFFIFIWSAVQLLRGRSSSHVELLGVFVLSIFGFFIAGVGGEMTLNGWLDKGKYAVHEVNVMDKYSTRNKNGYSYHVVVESWRQGHYSEKFSVRGSYYNHVEPGQSKMIITTKPGKLNFEWLVGYR